MCFYHTIFEASRMEKIAFILAILESNEDATDKASFFAA